MMSILKIKYRAIRGPRCVGDSSTVATQNTESKLYFLHKAMEQFLAILWYILILIPAIFWFLLIREFNAKTNSKFPSVASALLYLIPILGHCYVAWSFLKDLKEIQIKYHSNPIALSKTYITKFVLPDLFLVVGLNIFVIVGIFFFFIPVVGGPIGNSLIWLATFVPYLSFIWVAWGFWSTYKIVRNLTPTHMPSPKS